MISLVIEFDAHRFAADFTDEPTAYDWVSVTLRRLLHEYGMTQATRIMVLRR